MKFIPGITAAVLFASPAYAYIDPGTGSLLLQVLIGGAISAAASVVLWWQKLTGFFRRRNGKDENDKK